MSYSQQTWVNGGLTGQTAITDARLNHIEAGIGAAASTADAAVGKGDISFNVRDYGAKGDGNRVRNVTANTTSAAVTVPSGTFTSADVGKSAVVFTDTAAGTITTIASVQSATAITLSANAGITVSGTTGYITYGTNDSAAFNSAFSAAAGQAGADITVGANQPIGGGQPCVLVPKSSPDSLYILTSQVTVPAGVGLDGVGMIVNLLADRYAPVLIFSPFTTISTLFVEAMFGTGIQLGTGTSQQADIHAQKLVIWHAGTSTESSGQLRAQDCISMLGYCFVIDTIWTKGGARGIFQNWGSDVLVNRAFLIGSRVGISMINSNQVAYNTVILDTCGEPVSGASGIILDNGCADVAFNVQAFCVTPLVRVLDNVVLIGNGNTSKNIDLRFTVQAQKTGGNLVNFQQAQDVECTILASNTVSNSSGGNNITTAVIFGSIAGAFRATAEMDGTVTPYSGTPAGSYRYSRLGVEYSVQGGTRPTVAAGSNNGTSPPAPTVNGNDARGQISFGAGTAPGSGNQVVVTFSSTTGWVSAPFVTLTAVNWDLGYYVNSVSAYGFTIGTVNAPSPGSASTAYLVNYQVQG